MKTVAIWTCGVVAGLLGGIGADRFLLRPSAATRPVSGRAMGRPGGPGFAMTGDSLALPPYLEDLGLDDAQRRAAQSVLRRLRPRMDSVTRAAAPAMARIIEEARREIETILTPAQRERLPRGGGPPFLRGLVSADRR